MCVCACVFVYVGGSICLSVCLSYVLSIFDSSTSFTVLSFNLLSLAVLQAGVDYNCMCLWMCIYINNVSLLS